MQFIPVGPSSYSCFHFWTPGFFLYKESKETMTEEEHLGECDEGNLLLVLAITFNILYI